MNIIEQIIDFAPVNFIFSFLDVLLVWYVIYKVLTLIRGTKAVQLLKGLFVIIIARIVTEIFNLDTLGWMLQEVIDWGFLAIIIIFTPEIRRALEQIGRGKLFQRSGNQLEDEQARLIEAMKKAVSYMAKRRIGALISIEKETGLNEYIETGIRLDAHITSELIINTFIPNTPLHDGAVIIQKNRIAAAACYLPLSESTLISKELGTRHRAALGISEVTDSLTVVISEETGSISLTKNGELHRDLDLEEFKEMLKKELLVAKTSQTSLPRWNWRGRQNG